jgi:peptidoglycan/xylan/chitin deacetylase (PgdA/CDA1 family)
MFSCKKIIIFTCLLIITLGSSFTCAANNVTVFIYHRFGDSKFPTTNVSVEAFIQQMDYLQSHNYTVISLSDLVQKVKKGTTLPPKTAVITIDDAYQSVYENGWPVLQKYGFPFTIFVYTKGVDDNYGDYMTWTQLRELKEFGVDIQDHSYGHEHLGWKPEKLSNLAYQSWLSDDISKSKAILTRELGETPRFFALPYGMYNDLVLAELKTQGYEAVLTQDPGAVSLQTDLFMIPRQPILGREWATLKHFIKTLSAVDFPIADYQPAPSILKDPFIKTVKATIAHPEDYIDGTFGVWLSGLGWHQGVLKGNVISAEINKTLVRPTTRVVVSGRQKDSHDLATRTWLLIHPDGEKAGK